MFDFAWSEIGLIGLVAVVVLGPKELPQAMRALGRFTRQARKLAGEFQNHVNDLIREAELEEVQRTIQRPPTVSIGAEIDKLLDPDDVVGAAPEVPPSSSQLPSQSTPQPPGMVTGQAEEKQAAASAEAAMHTPGAGAAS